MDVERIQKINSLALNLMKQGLVLTRDEAVTEAEKIFKNSDDSNFSEIRERMEKTQERQAQTSSPQEELSHETIKGILEKNTSFLVKTIREFQEKILSLEKEVEKLRTREAYDKLPTVKEIVSHEVPPPTPTGKSAVEISANNPNIQRGQSKSSSDNHPRSGNYNEQDVSIEKFFYMGR